MGRTFAFGDIHGDLDGLERILSQLPRLDASDTLVFLGDYVDRGPKSAQVIERVRQAQRKGPARVVALRGNHEDAWLRVIAQGWPEFVMPPGNGCLAAMRSFTGEPLPEGEERPKPGEERKLRTPEYQQRLADAICRGLAGYFRTHPPEGTLFARQRHGADEPSAPAPASALPPAPQG